MYKCLYMDVYTYTYMGNTCAVSISEHSTCSFVHSDSLSRCVAITCCLCERSAQVGQEDQRNLTQKVDAFHSMRGASAALKKQAALSLLPLTVAAALSLKLFILRVQDVCATR
jgi:hypothetical protein